MVIESYQVRRALQQLSQRSLEPHQQGVAEILPVVALAQSTDMEAYVALREGAFPTLAVVTAATPKLLPPMKLKQLEVRFSEEYELEFDGISSRRMVSTLTLMSTDEDFWELFSVLSSAVLNDLAPHPTDKDFLEEIQLWTDLFQSNRSRSLDIVGLIGELTAIAASPSPERWAAAWHIQPAAPWDFQLMRSDGSAVVLEVKATRAAHRHHLMKLAQLERSEHENGYVVSVLVHLDDHAEYSVRDLMTHLQSRLDDSAARNRLESIVLKTVGLRYDEALSTTFDKDLTLCSVRYFASRDVPRPVLAETLPANVRGVQFVVEFDTVAHVPVADVEDL